MNIKITKKEVTGVINPLLHLEGNIKDTSFEIKLISNNKEIDYRIQKFLATGDFKIDSELNNSDKKVSVLFNNKEVCIIRNSKFKRILNRIKSKILIPVISIKIIFITFFKGIRFLWKEYHFLIPPKLWKKYLHEFKERIKIKDVNLYYNPLNVNDYNLWLKENEKEITDYKMFSYNPLISILIPVYNINREYLSDCIDSILNQSYENYEICLVDDASTNKETIDTLKEYEKVDKRIKVKYRKQNGHISNATNDALKMAKGEFVALLDNDDIITKDALYEMVNVLNKNKNIDMIYSDEDKINTKGFRCDPNFKPDYSPDTLLSSNYICHFTMLRKSIVEKIGGERVGFEGAQDFDLFLRFTEQTTRERIYHIPKILYHWRMVEGSTSMVIDNKSYALERGRKAVEEALKRRKIKGKVHIAENVPYYYCEYDLPKKASVSIIIPTKDLADITEKCINSIYEKSTYKDFEILLVNNNSEKKETFDMFDRLKSKHKNLRIIDANFEFNYSKINNLAVKEAKGDYVLLLNNDTEIITPNFIEIMVGYASQKHIGAVGAKLIYPDETIQHNGIIMGLGGVAGHAYANVSRNAIVWGGKTSIPTDFGGVTAACLMIEKKKFNEVKGLDEKIKVAFNDVDLNLKLLEKGYYNVCVPMVELYHYESKSRGMDTTTEKYNRFVSEVNLMTKRWEKELKNDIFYNPNYSLNKPYYLDKNKK